MTSGAFRLLLVASAAMLLCSACQTASPASTPASRQAPAPPATPAVTRRPPCTLATAPAPLSTVGDSTWLLTYSNTAYDCSMCCLVEVFNDGTFAFSDVCNAMPRTGYAVPVEVLGRLGELAEHTRPFTQDGFWDGRALGGEGIGGQTEMHFYGRGREEIGTDQSTALLEIIRTLTESAGGRFCGL